MSELHVVVGASHRRLPGDKGDQLVYGDDGGLVVYAATAIDGVIVSQHRPCLLVVGDARFVVLQHAHEGAHHVYRCQPWNPGPYDREGVVVDYDPDRLHNDRVERLHYAARAALLIALLPLVPVLGLLPEDAKKSLKRHGLLPAGSQMSSLLLEWILLLLVVIAELLMVIAGSIVGAVICALFALTLLIDIPHRLVLAAENRDIGMFAWPRELWRALRAPPLDAGSPPAPGEPGPVDDDARSSPSDRAANSARIEP